MRRADAAYQIAVRLRYRVSNGTIIWFFEMLRADQVLDHAFKQACANVAKFTELPVLFGTPE